MKAYKLSLVADITQGKLYGDDLTVSNVFIDSRNLVSNNYLFFAIKGERHDGNNYIADLYAQNVKSFVINSLPDDVENYPNAGFVLVDNTLAALQQFAAYHLNQFHIPVIGITGSNGKTIVKEWIAQLLEGDKKLIRSPKSYNSQVGVPLSVLLTDSDDELAVFEAGISKPGEMEKLEKIIRPEIGIITNIGEAHQENFLDINQKLDEKLKLFKRSKVLIYNSDCELINRKIKSQYDYLTLFTWGTKGNPDLKIEKIEEREYTTLIVFYYKNDYFRINVPFRASMFIEDIVHSISALLVLGYPMDIFYHNLMPLVSVEMRMELKEGINYCTIINDSYNSDINSLTIALDFSRRLNQYDKKTLILSDIVQSGQDEDILYRKVAKQVKEKQITRFIGIGAMLTKYSYLFDIDDKEFFIDTESFLASFKREKFNDESILIKGSRQFEFEWISSLLEKKIHETVLEVNLNALVNNLNYFRSLIKPGTKLMAMVKAFSYGSGSFEIANLLQFNNIDYIGVAFADEGVALREAGITMPIVVLNAEPGSFETMVDYSLEPEIYSFNSLKVFASVVFNKALFDYPIHIKLDTGMHRLGFMEDDIERLIHNLKEKNHLKVSSIFTHLAASDEAMHDSFTYQQIDLFDKLSTLLINELGYPVIRHALNSAGIERFPESQFDMVRLGIGLYGVSANNVNLENISTLRSTIVQIKNIPAGDTVGYGRKGAVEKNKRTAIIPIGYADGLNRKFSNGAGYFIVNGGKAPIIGNVCMDTCMIDVTDLNASEGDEVIIFGDKPNIRELAKQIETIPYEILTSISQRVKRIFVSD
ncbi:MAG: bifunctional UDP-N-acetylmuramoyl-tripeptide:D-alanyl-D-alanine ligase/alanine racemase [Prevotellaceae bacterium]|jgi:alanine racemase|nr:bifunctional UDP-N-acetylmuramoyl-tripeptide:D-alanyl-D-alanine ligase/alanine racemase [Prevotellaceae bacterium]